MAKPNTQSDNMMTNESPLARAEAARYVEQQKSADFNRNLSQYMFWGATSIMGAVALGMMTSGIAPLLMIGGAAASCRAGGAHRERGAGGDIARLRSRRSG